MVSELGLVLLTTVACFQLAVGVDPASALVTDDSEDRETSGVLQRWYLDKPSSRTSAAAVTRYLVDQGLY